MSLKVVKTEIERFLRTPEPEVLVVRGDWGTGKTFTWKRLLSEFQKDDLPTKRYSYVSLFGVNTLEDFRFLLFQQCIANSTIGTEPSMQSFKENAGAFAESYGRKASRFLNRIPIISDFMGEVRSLAYLSISEALICIDDLERKGKDLDAREILGNRFAAERREVLQDRSDIESFRPRRR